MDKLTAVLEDTRAEIHRRHWRQLRCIGVRVDTDDLYQMVCVRAWKARRKCRGSTAAEIRNWVLAIAANETRNLLVAHMSASKRTVKRTGRHELQSWDSSYQDNSLGRMIAEETLAEERSRVQAALPKLTPRRREVVRLRYMDEWPYPHIAERLGVRVDRSRTLASEGIRQVRKLISGYDAAS